MNDEPKIVHIARAEQDKDIPSEMPDTCPECKVPSEQGFGMAGGGFGVYTFCPQCGKLLGKIQCDD